MRSERFERNYATQFSTEILSTKLPGMLGAIANNANDKIIKLLDGGVSSISGENDDGCDEQLRLGQFATEADDSSYVIASAPNSVNTFMTSRSVDDLVVINTSLDSRGKD
jgi:hypothetical protein